MEDTPPTRDVRVVSGRGMTTDRFRRRAAEAGVFVVRAVPASTGWLGDRIDDIAQWPANLVRYLPARATRFVATLLSAVSAVAVLPLAGVRKLRTGDREGFGVWLRARVRAGLVRALQLLFEILDIFGIPELVAFLWRASTRTSPLRGEELAAIASVLGPRAVRYQDVRVAESGILNWVFGRNGGRAFVIFHTVNLPLSGHHTRDSLDILVHEMVHVYQYERAGSRYVAEALLAQHEEGYGYGGVDGLIEARAKGRCLRDYNREQQAQIAQDYFVRRNQGGDCSAFEPYIAELRQGRL